MKKLNRAFFPPFITAVIMQLIAIGMATLTIIELGGIPLFHMKILTTAFIVMWFVLCWITVGRLSLYITPHTIHGDSYGAVKGPGGLMVLYNGGQYVFKSFAAGLFDPENKVQLKAYTRHYLFDIHKPETLVSLNDGHFKFPGGD